MIHNSEAYIVKSFFNKIYLRFTPTSPFLKILAVFSKNVFTMYEEKNDISSK